MEIILKLLFSFKVRTTKWFQANICLSSDLWVFFLLLSCLFVSVDNEPVQQLSFSFRTSGIRTQGKGETKKKGRWWGFFFFFLPGWVSRCKWLIQKRCSTHLEHELSELSENWIAVGVSMETQTYLCRWSEYPNLLTKCHTKTHKRAQSLLGEKRGLGEAISEEVGFKHNPFVCTHKLTKNSYCLISIFLCTIQWVKYEEMKRWYLVFHNISALHGAA